MLLALPAAAALVHVAFAPLPLLAVWLRPARLAIVSDPSGAEVYLDGQRLAGLTPTATNIRRDRRTHILELRREGFRPSRRPVRFDLSEELSLAISLTPGSRPSFRPMPLPLPRLLMKPPAHGPGATPPSRSR